jgi:hypothetical protein
VVSSKGIHDAPLRLLGTALSRWLKTSQLTVDSVKVQNGAIIGVSDYVDSGLSRNTNGMPGTRHAKRCDACDRPVKSWPALVLHPRGTKHQSLIDGAALHVRGLY